MSNEIKGTIATEETIKGRVDIGKGDSAYEAAVKNGFEGTETEWLETLKGKSGVYVGSGEMPDDCNVQIDPDGDVAIIDQSYSPKSQNPQSGIAVAQAISNFGSVIKQTVSGEVITANDVSPIEHELKVKVKSKNLLTYPYEQTNNSVYNITATANTDGSITINGTSSTIGGGFAILKLCTLDLKAGNYTFSVKHISGTVENSSTPWILYSPNIDGNFFTGFTPVLNSDQTVELYLQIWMNDSTYTNVATYTNYTIMPQFEIGSTATDVVSPVLSTVKVSRYGKNLLDVATAPVYHMVDNSKPYSYIKTDTGFKATFNQAFPNGTSLRHGYNLGKTEDLRGKTITLSGNYSSTVAGSRMAIYVYSFYIKEGYSGDNSAREKMVAAKERANSLTFTVDDTVKAPYIGVWFYIGLGGSPVTGDTAEWSNIQLEINNTATEYEPYIEPITATANADGTVNGITSISPNITLLTDKGVTLECEYNADTKMYIDNKFAELSAAILNS